MTDAEVLQSLHETSPLYPSPNHDCIPVRLSTLIEIERIGRLDDVGGILNIDIDRNTRPCASNFIMLPHIIIDRYGGDVVEIRPILMNAGFAKSTTRLKKHLTMKGVQREQWLLFYKAGRTPVLKNNSWRIWNSWCSSNQSEIMT